MVNLPPTAKPRKVYINRIGTLILFNFNKRTQSNKVAYMHCVSCVYIQSIIPSAWDHNATLSVFIKVYHLLWIVLVLIIFRAFLATQWRAHLHPPHLNYHHLHNNQHRYTPCMCMCMLFISIMIIRVSCTEERIMCAIQKCAHACVCSSIIVCHSKAFHVRREIY